MILAGATQPARGDRVPEDGEGDRPDGGRADPGERAAVAGAASEDCGAELGAQPVLDLEALNALELADVVGDEDCVEREGVGRDEHVVLSDGLASPLKFSPDCSVGIVDAGERGAIRKDENNRFTRNASEDASRFATPYRTSQATMMLVSSVTSGSRSFAR